MTFFIERELQLERLISQRSHFLFGPRGTGKSSLIKVQLPGNVDYIDLLRSDIYFRLQARPSELEAMLRGRVAVIGEVQRIPALLNEVHRLIEDKGIRFLLTGSSARKLKRGAANLLAGRAYTAALYPLTYHELQRHGSFDLGRRLLHGGLPTAVTDSDPAEYLHAYVDAYLKEEIQAEALVRNLGNFARFIEVAAAANAELINYSKVGNDAQLSPNTVRDYFQILEDTLLGFQLPAWTRSKKRKAIQTSKFYFFDIGVANTINRVRELNEKSDLFGKAFEHFIGMELRAYLSYRRIREPLQYWRSTSQFEVDYVVGDNVAIEVKSARNASERDHRGLKAIGEEGGFQKLFLVSRDEQRMSYDSGIINLHWRDFLNDLWNDAII